MKNPILENLQARGITHQNLADRLDVTRSSINQAIHGLTMSRRILDMIDSLLGWQPGTACRIAAEESQERKKTQMEATK